MVPDINESLRLPRISEQKDAWEVWTWGDVWYRDIFHGVMQAEDFKSACVKLAENSPPFAEHFEEERMAWLGMKLRHKRPTPSKDQGW